MHKMAFGALAGVSAPVPSPALLPAAMKFHLSATTGNVVTGHGPGWVRVGATEYRENLVLTPEAVAPGWAPGGFEALAEADFTRLLEGRPDVVLLGTGSTIRFPHPRLTRALAGGHVGLEVMDTAAACRTFNILSAEGRRVTAALIL
jgi:uncharacterized protein